MEAQKNRSLDPSGPNSVPGELPLSALEVPRSPAPPLKAESGFAVLTSSLIGSRPNNRRSTSEQCKCAERMSANTCALDSLRLPVMLLRKEVIQPHLPVRLPCYDFVPIAGPTFDSSLPQGVGPPASGVTDFRDVTGGVYKARERIHRSVADLRLLATPTSRGRVADPDPN